jgi:hypothetical protein
MKTTKNGTLLRLALAAALAITPVTATLAQSRPDDRAEQQSRRAGSLAVPVSGTVRPEANPEVASPLTGTFTIQRFAKQDDAVVAIGTLTASFTDPLTNTARTVVTQAALPFDRQASGSQAAAAAAEASDLPARGPAVAQQAACDILNLVLGPLDLNLLGLRVQLNQVVLDITAVPGSGNLLGNLLCAVAGLLDGPGPLARLVALLNELLAVLG